MISDWLKRSLTGAQDKYAHSRVIECGAKQTPQKNSYKQQGDVFIALNPYVSRQPHEIADYLTDPRPKVRLLGLKELMATCLDYSIRRALTTHERTSRK